MRYYIFCETKLCRWYLVWAKQDSLQTSVLLILIHSYTDTWPGSKCHNFVLLCFQARSGNEQERQPVEEQPAGEHDLSHCASCSKFTGWYRLSGTWATTIRHNSILCCFLYQKLHWHQQPLKSWRKQPCFYPWKRDYDFKWLDSVKFYKSSSKKNRSMHFFKSLLLADLKWRMVYVPESNLKFGKTTMFLRVSWA